MKNRYVLVGALSLVCFGAAADPTWGPLERITSVETSPSGTFVASPSYSACGSTQTKVALTDVQTIKQLYATALSAYLTGKPVRLLTDGCEGPYYRLFGIAF